MSVHRPVKMQPGSIPQAAPFFTRLPVPRSGLPAAPQATSCVHQSSPYLLPHLIGLAALLLQLLTALRARECLLYGLSCLCHFGADLVVLRLRAGGRQGWVGGRRSAGCPWEECTLGTGLPRMHYWGGVKGDAEIHPPACACAPARWHTAPRPASPACSTQHPGRAGCSRPPGRPWCCTAPSGCPCSCCTPPHTRSPCSGCRLRCVGEPELLRGAQSPDA